MNRLYMLLTVMVVMVVAALFTAHQEVRAQDPTGTTGTTATTDESALCQNPQQVLETTETGDSENTFTTTTNVFRVNYDGTGFDPFPDSTAQIRIRTTSGQVVDTQTINADESISFSVNASPGTYEVVVGIDPPAQKSYIVSVEQCRETTPPPTGDIATCQNPQQVLETTETGDSENTFTTTTNVFRVNYDGTGSAPFPASDAKIRIRTTSGQVVDTQTINADESISFSVNASPGTYEVVVGIDPPAQKSYIVSVEQCRETTPPPTGDIVSCQNAREELRVGPRSGDFNDTFTTTGDFFFVNYEVSFDEAAPSTASAEIRIIDEGTQQVVESIPLSADAADSFIVAQGAGTYRLEIAVDPDDAANYTVTVDDCLRTTTGTTDTNVTQTPGTGTTVTETPGTGTTVIQTPGTGTTVTQTPGTGTTVTQDVVPKPKDVLGDTIPGGEPLPNTGGLSFLGLALALLTLLIIGATKVLLSVVRR